MENVVLRGRKAADGAAVHVQAVLFKADGHDGRSVRDGLEHGAAGRCAVRVRGGEVGVDDIGIGAGRDAAVIERAAGLEQGREVEVRREGDLTVIHIIFPALERVLIVVPAELAHFHGDADAREVSRDLVGHADLGRAVGIDDQRETDVERGLPVGNVLALAVAVVVDDLQLVEQLLCLIQVIGQRLVERVVIERARRVDGQRGGDGAVVQQRNGERAVNDVIERLAVARRHEKAAVGVEADILQVRRGILALVVQARKAQVRAGAGVAERKVELAVIKRGDDLLDRLALHEIDHVGGGLVRIRVAGIDREALVVRRELIQPRTAGVGAVGRAVFDDRNVQQRGKLRVRARERDRDGAVVVVLDVLDGAQAAGIQGRCRGSLDGIGRVLRIELVAVVEGAVGIDGEGPGLAVVAAPLGEQPGLGLKGVGELRERLIHEAADGEVIGILRLVGVHAGGRAVVERELAVELNGGLRVLLADGVAGVVRGLFAAGRAAEQQHERKREREHAGQVQMFHGLPPLGHMVMTAACTPRCPLVARCDHAVFHSERCQTPV